MTPSASTTSSGTATRSVSKSSTTAPPASARAAACTSQWATSADTAGWTWWRRARTGCTSSRTWVTGMVKFGLRVPEFAMDGTPAARLLHQAGDIMASGRRQFASASISDYFLPWADQGGSSTDNLVGWITLYY